MAVVQNPITGRSKQKYASAIFSTWKGINVLRSLPLTVANPRTPGQLLQRAKLSIMVALYRLMPGVIATGYRQQAVKMSEYNAFGSDTLRNAFTGSTVDDLQIHLSAIKVSKGTMASTPVENLSIGVTESTIDWDATAPLSPGQALSDLAQALVIGRDPITEAPVVLGIGQPVARSAGTIDIPTINTGSFTDQHGYLFFSSVIGAQVSDSVSAETA